MTDSGNQRSFLTIGSIREFDFPCDRNPAKALRWTGEALSLDDCGTHFGFVRRGCATVSVAHGAFPVQSGMYFAAPGDAEITGTGDGFVATHVGYRGFFQLGGPIEEKGRLRYIDGCSDSVLIAPVMRGDPCLNLLHVPAGTNQTAHTHPSLRVGMIVDGGGVCRTPDEEIALTPGLVFVIRAGGLHSFHTREQPLRIIAWHPDSDCGPTHERHPMLNRTYVDGRSVNSSGERE